MPCCCDADHRCVDDERQLLPKQGQIHENLRRQEEELTKLRALTSDIFSRHPNVLTFLHLIPSRPPKVEPSLVGRNDVHSAGVLLDRTSTRR